MNITPVDSDVAELRDLFERYSQDDETITLQCLQKLATDCKLPVSHDAMKQFFKSNVAIDFVEFAQFIRHQETTLKKFFHFLDKNNVQPNDSLSIGRVKNYISLFNSDVTSHYFWSVDPKWADLIFKGINERRNYSLDRAIKYDNFRKEVLLSSTASAQEYYTFQRNQLAHQLDPDKQYVSGITNAELTKMFESLSHGKGFIDIRALYGIVKESKIPVSEHQLVSFFIGCDIKGNNRIDFFEFVHFMRSEEQAIRHLFKSLDLDKTGYLTPDEIQRSFHIKYIKDHKGNLSQSLRNDMNKIDDWVTSVVTSIPSSHNHGNNDPNKRRIYYEDFRTYAMLSGARSLLTMIQSHEQYKAGRNTTPFLFDFDDIYLPSKPHEDDYNIVFSGDTKRQLKLNLITFLSGTVAGIVSRTATAPIDRVKLMMQFKSHGSIGSHVHNIMNESKIPNRPQLFSFWRGNMTNCIKMAPETAIKFTVHNMFLRFLREQLGVTAKDRQYHLNFIAGAGAGVVSQTMVYPLEIAKTRLALSQHGQYRNFVHCIQSIYRYEGPRSLYNGWIASVTGIVPYCAIEMGVFFSIKDKWHQRYGYERQPDWVTLFGFGGAASISGTIVAYPFQLVRTKLQTQGMPGNTARFRGLWDCFRQTWGTYGFFGLYSGIVPNFAKSIPATCISYLVVEKTKSFLKTVVNMD